jgi:hypothetical protein
MKLNSIFPLILIGLFSITISFNSHSQVIEIYGTPGWQNWTVPCGVTQVSVAVYGAGGGGGGCNSSTFGGGGGGAGGFAETLFNVTPGSVIPFFVGAGGAGGNFAGNGQNGQQSQWNGVLTCTGGTGGFAEDNGGGGGTGGTAPLWAGGINGANGNAGGDPSGGNGGAAAGPNGGNSGVGGGAAIDGGVGGNYGGGGGGGGKKNNGINTNGGQGANGAIVITYTSIFTQADAGPDVSTCNVVFLQGSTPSPGWTGTWSIISGAPIIADVNDPNSEITIPAPGTCATVRWTFTSPGCADMIDEVTICYPLICNDDPCGAIDLTVGTTGCTPTVYTNVGATASTGMVEPGCGDYSDNDVWYSATVPANGVLTVELSDAAGGPAMEMGVAVYEGPDCNNLTHQGCDFYDTGNLPDNTEMTYTGTPGSTVWFRVWDANENEDSYNLCAHTHTNAPGDVLEGMNVISCGGGVDGTFFDPGGDGGNYEDNSSSTYTICPDTPGQYISLDFNSGPNFFSLGTGNDYLTILDGGADSNYIIGQYTGTNSPGIITSSFPDGCLTLVFNADVSGNAAGWEADINCSNSPGVNDTLCSATNCTGGCGQWVCEDGLYPTENNGNALQDVSGNTAGCLDPTTGEIAAHWFYFTVLTTGTIEFSFNGPNGQDYNMGIWGPSTNGIPPCPLETGLPPVLCSQADAQNTGNPVGSSTTLGGGQFYEGPEGDGWVTALNGQAGETYAMLLNIFQNGNPQPVIDMTIGGSGTLDCLPISIQLSANLHSFDGMNQGDENLIYWVTDGEYNNDFFTVERSINGFDWEVVGTVDGAGTSYHGHYYELRDYNPYFPVTYYRLKQTDFDGSFNYFNTISVSGDPLNGDFVTALFPNPTESYATFMYNGHNTKDPLTVQVVNEMGAVVMTMDYNQVYPNMPATIRTEELSYGMYHVTFTQGDQKMIQKLSVLK